MTDNQSSDRKWITVLIWLCVFGAVFCNALSIVAKSILSNGAIVLIRYGGSAFFGGMMIVVIVLSRMLWPPDQKPK
ncbi:MAG: hypothetical protein WC477_03310 [Patescibacteria group bacterium]